MMMKSLHPKSVIILITSCCLVASQTQGQGGGGSPSSSTSTGSSCSAPPEGCTNGMFKQSTCTCQCIPPFCPVDGNCLAVVTSCEDPWKDCKMGVDCPWWPNYLTTDECTTGPVVPFGLWRVYSSEEECCSTNFPDSTTCYIPMEVVPTKHPTIALENTDGEETVPIQFVVTGVPDDVSLNAVKVEMLSALKRVLLRLTEENPDMEVINVEEQLMRRKRTKKKTRHLLKKESTLLMPLLLPQEERITHSPMNHHHHYRSLEQNVEVVFNVTVVSRDNIQFGPFIIEAIRNSYDEVISEIQSFSDITYIGGLDMNFCTMESGGYNNCAVEKPGVAPSSSPYGGGGGGGGGSGSSTSISSTDSEVKFTVYGLPDLVDNDLLEEEMLLMMRKVLIDLSAEEPDLKVTKVEKNPSYSQELSTNAKNDSDDNGRSISIYYDVTVINDQTKDFGQFIISGLRDLYPAISQDINDCTGMVYFHYGVGVNWCIDGEGMDGNFGACVATHPKTTVEFRLANIPLQLNVDELIQQVVEIYEKVLAPVEDLNILTMEMKKVVDRASSNNTLAKDVYVEVVDQKLVINSTSTKDDPVLGSIIDEHVKSSKYEILRLIQLYTDNSTDLDLNWCIDGNGTYTVCANTPTPMPTEPPKPYPFLLPMWAVITLTVVSVLLTCCLCWCTFSFLEQRDASKNARNMVSYLHTGQQYSKPKRKPIRLPPQQLPLQRRNSRSVPNPRGRQRYYETQPKVEPVSLLNDTRYLENLPSLVFPHDDEPPPVRASDTLYLENMDSFIFDDGQPPPRLAIAANETLYLEDAPSFIFDDDEGQSHNRLAITNGVVSMRSKPDPP